VEINSSYGAYFTNFLLLLSIVCRTWGRNRKRKRKRKKKRKREKKRKSKMKKRKKRKKKRKMVKCLMGQREEVGGDGKRARSVVIF
jgi:hypothetical protein